jgi:hypothetical protein
MHRALSSREERGEGKSHLSHSGVRVDRLLDSGATRKGRAYHARTGLPPKGAIRGKLLQAEMCSLQAFSARGDSAQPSAADFESVCSLVSPGARCRLPPELPSGREREEICRSRGRRYAAKWTAKETVATIPRPASILVPARFPTPLAVLGKPRTIRPIHLPQDRSKPVWKGRTPIRRSSRGWMVGALAWRGV